MDKRDKVETSAPHFSHLKDETWKYIYARLRDSLLGKVFALLKDPSLIPRTSITMPGIGSKSYDPRVEDVETEESLGLAGQPVEPN